MDGWTPSSTTAIVVNNTSASTGYSSPIAASGGNNLSLGECGGNTQHTVVSPAISTVGRTDIMVGFGRRKTAAFGPQVVIFEFSTNGGTTWTNISSDVSSVATTTWSLSVFTLPTAAENQSSLTFRFRYTLPANTSTACATSFRIDDFTVSENRSLPVDLIYFRGTAGENSNQLTWETAWERHSSHFIVERSADAQTFIDMGQVQSAGNSTTNRLYHLTDGEPLAGTSYYRLRQVDTDGRAQVSKIIFVNRAEEPLAVCENPTSGHEIRLKASNADPGSLRVQTNSGQSLPFRLVQQTESDWLIRPTNALQPGLYLISVGQQNRRRIIRFVVQ
ncbi:hypothetical protein GCM10027299_03910 [Larkinella ripae]